MDYPNKNAAFETGKLGGSEFSLPYEVEVEKEFLLPNKNAAFETGTLGGSGKLEKEFFLPFEGKTLRGAAAAKQIKDWTAGGVIEADTAEALLPMCESSDFIKNLGNKVFVLLGGLSEMR